MDDIEIEAKQALEEEWTFSTERERWAMVAEHRTPPSMRERVEELTACIVTHRLRTLEIQAQSRIQANIAILENLRGKNS